MIKRTILGFVAGAILVAATGFAAVTPGPVGPPKKQPPVCKLGPSPCPVNPNGGRR
jgi:hypothetical protein